MSDTILLVNEVDPYQKYYIEPKLSSPGPCLSRGYDRFIKRDESVPEHLDTLLDTLTTARLNGSPDVDHVDIVCMDHHISRRSFIDECWFYRSHGVGS